MTLIFLLLLRAEGRFYPSGCGGHKNSENAATFSEFLGQEEKSTLRAYIDETAFASSSLSAVGIVARSRAGLQSPNFAKSISETAPIPPVRNIDTGSKDL